MTKTKKSLTYCQQLVERLRAAQGGATDYRLAKTLGISQQSISYVKNKGTTFSDETLNKIAQLLGENPMLIIADSHLETQDFPGMNNVWEHMKMLAMKEEMEKYQGVIEERLGNVSGL